MKSTVLFFIVLMSTQAVNAIEFYAGGSISTTSSRSNLPYRFDTKRNFNNTAINFILGKKIFSTVSAELRAVQYISAVDYPTEIGEIRNTYTLETSISAVLKNDIYSKENFSIYNLLGVTNLVTRFKNTAIHTENNPTTGASFNTVKTNVFRTSSLEPGIGLGIEYGINSTVSFQLEYYKIFDSDRLHDLTAINLGATYAF